MNLIFLPSEAFFFFFLDIALLTASVGDILFLKLAETESKNNINFFLKKSENLEKELPLTKLRI